MFRECWDIVASFLLAKEQMKHALTSKQYFELYFWGCRANSGLAVRSTLDIELANLKLNVRRPRVFYFSVQDALNGLLHGTVPPPYSVYLEILEIGCFTGTAKSMLVATPML